MKAGKDLPILLTRFTNRQFIKYVIGGLVNTLLSYILYLVFLSIFSYHVSFAVSYILGIVIAYIINSVFVFRASMSVKKMLAFPLVYVVQFILNYLFITLFIEWFHLSEKATPLIVTIICIPITFLLSKSIIRATR